MSKIGPIIIISDRDTNLFELIVKDLGVESKIIYFTRPQNAIDYILSFSESSFLVFYEINTFVLTGINIKQKINQDLEWNKKNIPLIFYSISSGVKTTDKDKAYLKMLLLNFYSNFYPKK